MLVLRFIWRTTLAPQSLDEKLFIFTLHLPCSLPGTQHQRSSSSRPAMRGLMLCWRSTGSQMRWPSQVESLCAVSDAPPLNLQRRNRWSYDWDACIDACLTTFEPWAVELHLHSLRVLARHESNFLTIVVLSQVKKMFLPQQSPGLYVASWEPFAW